MHFFPLLGFSTVLVFLFIFKKKNSQNRKKNSLLSKWQAIDKKIIYKIKIKKEYFLKQKEKYTLLNRIKKKNTKEKGKLNHSLDRLS